MSMIKKHTIMISLHIASKHAVLYNKIKHKIKTTAPWLLERKIKL